MNTIKLDLNRGLVSVNSAPIELDERGVLSRSIEKLCSPPSQTDEGRAQYRLSKKSTVYGKSADVLIQVGEGRLYAIAFLFDFIEFFESSVLESRILKSYEKTFDLIFVSNHPSTAFLEPCEWGQAKFFYDAKQGDLSLDLIFTRFHNELE